MREMGISHVRIAEFAWSLIEPEADKFDWTWLDRVIDTLHRESLSVVMCTPTATPPKWLIDGHPDVLAVDANGVPRHFGARRHYCFSSKTYRDASKRITRLLAKRYGEHPAVVAWQTDNEYGCHDTVLSYSQSARLAFRTWLQVRHTTIDALNTAWGTTFWSQRYNNFDQIDPPVATVTEANPAHRLDWQRFASDEVVAFNREQVTILRELSPGRPITHNFMGFFTAFNHHDLAHDLDIASWDSYPLGFTQMFFLTADEKTRWARTGHPDIPAFHHDLYRGMCVAGQQKGDSRRGRWWVMEQQPGPVNWAHWNPSPYDGMVRLWTWQAFAHGAELVSYFRWRQVPFAQEQMHAGLLRPDRSDDQGAREAQQVGRELKQFAQDAPVNTTAVHSDVALVFDYEAMWMLQIQPQGADYNPTEISFRVYSALRSLGLNVDIVSPNACLKGYRLIVLPAQTHVPPALLTALSTTNAEVILGPRAGSKTSNFQIPENLAPGCLAHLAGIAIKRVSSLPPGMSETVLIADHPFVASRWREDIELRGAVVEATFADASVAISRHQRVRYVGTWLEPEGWRALLRSAAMDAHLSIADLPPTLRVSQIGDWVIACNFSEEPQDWTPPSIGTMLLGATPIPSHDIAIWTSAIST
jgi:beta-galactosidase